MLKQEFVKAAARFEAERLSKHKSILKYAQESFNRRGKTEGAKKDRGDDEESNDASSVTLRLADSQLDDETCHGVAALILTNCPACQDTYFSAEEDAFRSASNRERADSILQNVPTVRALICRDNFLGDAAAHSLCDLIRKSQSLKLLDLRGNALSEVGIAALKSAALANRSIERVESRSKGTVLVAHTDSDIAVNSDPLIIDIRHNDVEKIDNLMHLNPASCEKLLSDLEKIAPSSRRLPSNNNRAGPAKVSRTALAARTLGKVVNRRARARRARGEGAKYKSHLSRRGVKEEGGFGRDFIDYALTAPPQHMPLKTSAFLTEVTSDKLIGKTSGRDKQHSGDFDADSAAASAAAASDAPPGERELGQLLDKKIKLMERRMKGKHLSTDRNGSRKQVGFSGGASKRRWASSSSSGTGLLRGSIRAGGAAAAGRLRGSSVRPHSATAVRSRTSGMTTFGRELKGRAGITRPPTSTLRPKSAAFRRLPFRG